MPIAPRPRWDPLTEVVLCPTQDGGHFVGGYGTGGYDPGGNGPGGNGPSGHDTAGNGPGGYSGDLASPAGTRTHRGADYLTGRDALIDGARQALLHDGTHFEFADVARDVGMTMGQARHYFPDRDQLLAGVLIDELDKALATVAHRGLAEALIQAADTVSNHPILDALADEPALLARLAQVDVTCAGWRIAAEAIEAALSRCGRRGSPFVLRWLASLLVSPAEAGDVAADVAILVAGLPPAVDGIENGNGWTDRRTG